MRFEQVWSPIKNARMWAAKVGDYSFVIMHEKEGGPGFEGWTGYTATWKDRRQDMRPKLPGYGGTQQINPILPGDHRQVWGSFAEAEEACRATLRQLRRKH